MTVFWQYIVLNHLLSSTTAGRIIWNIKAFLLQLINGNDVIS